MSRNLRCLNWHDFSIAISRLEYQLKNVKNAVGVYGVPRGGLMLAVALSHRLGLPLLLEPQDGMIWVDDIIDSGKTVKEMAHKPAAIGCWVNRNNAQLADVSAYVLFDDDWIVFPWEQEYNALYDLEAYECSR